MRQICTISQHEARRSDYEEAIRKLERIVGSHKTHIDELQALVRSVNNDLNEERRERAKRTGVHAPEPSRQPQPGPSSQPVSAPQRAPSDGGSNHTVGTNTSQQYPFQLSNDSMGHMPKKEHS